MESTDFEDCKQPTFPSYRPLHTANIFSMCCQRDHYTNKTHASMLCERHILSPAIQLPPFPPCSRVRRLLADHRPTFCDQSYVSFSKLPQICWEGDWARSSIR